MLQNDTGMDVLRDNMFIAYCFSKKKNSILNFVE